MNYLAKFLNLPSRVDRLNHMTAELARVGLSAERHAAKTPDQVDKFNPKYSVMLNRTPGAIPCHLGQVEIMQEALASGKDAMVFEDDLVFATDIKERLEYIDKWTNGRAWDVIWLGASFHSPAFWHCVGGSKMRPNVSANLGIDCEPTDDPRMIRTYGAFSTHAYIVNVHSIEKITALLDKYVHESIGIDHLFIRIQPQLKCFSFVPGCVKQIDNQSNIGTGMTIWSGFLKLNGSYENSRYVFQDNMNDFNPEGYQWT